MCCPPDIRRSHNRRSMHTSDRPHTQDTSRRSRYPSRRSPASHPCSATDGPRRPCPHMCRPRHIPDSRTRHCSYSSRPRPSPRMSPRSRMYHSRTHCQTCTPRRSHTRMCHQSRMTRSHTHRRSCMTPRLPLRTRCPRRIRPVRSQIPTHTARRCRTQGTTHHSRCPSHRSPACRHCSAPGLFRPPQSRLARWFQRRSPLRPQ